MSDIWSAVQWWDEWQLRILVLGSLGFQWFLVLVVPMRNYTVQRWIRACIRLASICADVLAIYALATLLYRQAAGRAQQVRSLPLEALWAPLLVVHLGGREELTASGMDDDTALWVRHAAVLVTVTVYAFFTSLRYFSDGFKLLASAALLLVAAVVSSCGKPWVLRRASVRRLVAKSSLAKGGRTTKLGDWYKCWKELKPRGTAPMLLQGDKVQMLLSGMSLHAARATLETRKAKPDQEILEPLKPWRREQHEALEPPKVGMIMKPWLRQAFGLIYTRATAMYLACHAMLVPSLYVAATVLFFFAVSYKKHGYSRYSRADVNTTYALLCFTAALDVLGMFVSEVMYSLLSSSSGAKLLGASSCENLPGHNLMDSVLWTIRWPMVSMLLLRCYKGGYFVKDEDRLYVRVLDSITNKLEDKDKGKIFDLDLSSYRSLSKRNWILRDKELKAVSSIKTNNIRDSLRKKPFDASVIIWHIATDLCFRVKSPEYFRFRPPPNEEVVREVCTEAISNYMAYLLDSWPEMLMAGSRQHLFTEAMANMERVVGEATKDLRPKLGEKQPLDDVILRKIKKEAASLKEKEAYTVIDDACKLADELLLGIQDHETRWELMHRVWVGMLCYSASMCWGDLHAKSLGEGGEFISNVWLLISLIGCRTLEDKLQMPDDEPEAEPEAAGSSAPNSYFRQWPWAFL
ncbi:unnamed protein product [Miscanthus lutarioriparius]|uniref:DUF4220 domain-containing protein n=1 Tax=Miscanthus lutarioriparius TaxID=422564 RepID=A0A811REU0_9POAL|nr:unnamed protein product [Miscanthus lutarioriparius]